MIKPPVSRIGPAKKAEHDAVFAASPIAGVYDQTEDRESAFELLSKRASEKAEAGEKAKPSRSRTLAKPKPKSNRQGIGETFMKSMARSLGSKATQSLIRGVMGSLFKG